MASLNAQMTIGDIVRDRPARATVFEHLGIDYCCGGKKPLAEACAKRGIDPAQVLDALSKVDGVAPSGPDPAKMSLAELSTHIEQVHHGYLKRELPRLGQIIHKVASVHGGHRPELHEVHEIFVGFRDELEQHMVKEEQVLFPMIRQLEAAATAPSFHCGSLRNPIRVMEHEHDSAGDALARMRELTDGFTPPPEACNTYRVMLDSLAYLERDMHQHVHKENNILFPAAAKLEAQRAAPRN